MPALAVIAVVLIDEYEAPIIDNISNFKLAQANCQVLSTFFKVLKDDDKYIKLIFVTGVAKVSHTSIFSGGNNLKDISLYPQFANICGFTSEDLNTQFLDRLTEMIELGLPKTNDKSEQTIETLREKILSWI